MDIYVCLSPLNHFVADVFIKANKKPVVIVSTTQQENQFQEKFDNPYVKEYYFLNKETRNYAVLFFYFLKLKKSFLKGRAFDRFYYFHWRDFQTALTYNNISSKETIYIDEAMITREIIEFREKNYVQRIFQKKTSTESFLSYTKRLLSRAAEQTIYNKYTFYSVFKNTNLFLEKNKRITKAYLNFTDKKLFPKKTYPFPILSLEQTMASHQNIVKKTMERFPLPKKTPSMKYLFLSQPLYEDLRCSYDEQIAMLVNFAKSQNSTEKIYIKLHPREKHDKYDKLIKENPRFVLFSEKVKVPYELLHSQLKPTYLITYFSNAAFTSQTFYPSKKIYLLLNKKSLAKEHEYFERYFGKKKEIEIISE